MPRPCLCVRNPLQRAHAVSARLAVPWHRRVLHVLSGLLMASARVASRLHLEHLDDDSFLLILQCVVALEAAPRVSHLPSVVRLTVLSRAVMERIRCLRPPLRLRVDGNAQWLQAAMAKSVWRLGTLHLEGSACTGSVTDLAWLRGAFFTQLHTLSIWDATGLSTLAGLGACMQGMFQATAQATSTSSQRKAQHLLFKSTALQVSRCLRPRNGVSVDGNYDCHRMLLFKMKLSKYNHIHSV